MCCPNIHTHLWLATTWLARPLFVQLVDGTHTGHNWARLAHILASAHTTQLKGISLVLDYRATSLAPKQTNVHTHMLECVFVQADGIYSCISTCILAYPSLPCHCPVAINIVAVLNPLINSSRRNTRVASDIKVICCCLQ
jgi:hypothetical protein